MTRKSKFNNGSVKISNDIITLIAGKAALDVEGVYCLISKQGEEIFRVDNNAARALNIEIGRNSIMVDVDLVIKNDFKIREVCREVQEKIAKDINVMTGLEVSVVNVNVEKLQFN